MQDYIHRLLEQFKKSKGIVTIEDSLISITEEFVSFVIGKGEDGAEFRNYLEYLGLDHYRFASTIEYGKGSFDSVVKPNKTTIVSPFGGSIEGVNDSRIIVSRLAVSNNLPVLVNDKEKTVLNFGNPYRTVLSHNSYIPGMIRNWEDLHNSSSYSIIYGVFGKLTDKDREEKVKSVEELRDKLLGDYTYRYDTKKDSYFCAVGSNFPMRKVKVKTMDRDLGIDYPYTR